MRQNLCHWEYANPTWPYCSNTLRILQLHLGLLWVTSQPWERCITCSGTYPFTSPDHAKLQRFQSPALATALPGRKSHLGSSLSELRSLLLRRAAGDWAKRGDETDRRPGEAKGWWDDGMMGWWDDMHGWKRGLLQLLVSLGDWRYTSFDVFFVIMLCYHFIIYKFESRHEPTFH